VKVESIDDRQKMPEECDMCGASVPLVRDVNQFGGIFVSWLCPYCRSDIFQGKSSTARSVAAMMNVLEERIVLRLKDENKESAT